MCYSASTLPRSAPADRRPAESPMTRRRPEPSAPSPRLLAALKALDIDCDCKPSLIVSCAVGAVSGCRERRHERTCGCKPRYLPTCILDTPDGAGCPLWKEGKTCACSRRYMPRCLAVGCDQRRKGKRCECPRTPLELCPHVAAKIQEFAALGFDEAARMADVWAEQLWLLLPQEYADRPLAAAGCTTRTQEAAVNLMAFRQALGLSPFHPEDERTLDGEERCGKLQRQAAGLRRLLGAATVEKGRAA